MKDKRIHKQSRRHPFRRYIATTKDSDRDEFYIILQGTINGNNVGNVNCAFNGGGK